MKVIQTVTFYGGNLDKPMVFAASSRDKLRVQLRDHINTLIAKNPDLGLSSIMPLYVSISRYTDWFVESYGIKVMFQSHVEND